MKSGTTTSLIYLSADRKYQAAGGSFFFGFTVNFHLQSCEIQIFPFDSDILGGETSNIF